MNDKLYNTILNAIPLYANETYLEREDRELIAKSIHDSLNIGCDHKWVTLKEVKIIDPKVCSICGQLQCKHE